MLGRYESYELYYYFMNAREIQEMDQLLGQNLFPIFGYLCKLVRGRFSGLFFIRNTNSFMMRSSSHP